MNRCRSPFLGPPLRAALICALALASVAGGAEAQTFDPQIVPNPLTLAIGGAPGAATVATQPSQGFSFTVTYEILGLPSFIQTGGTRVVPFPHPATVFPISLGPAASPGAYQGVLRGTAGGMQVNRPFTVIVEPPPGFVASVAPSVVELTVGAGATSVAVSTVPEPGFSAPVSYSFSGLPGFIATGGAQSALPPGYPELRFPFSLGAGARPGTYSGVLRGAGGGSTTEVPIRVIVRPAPTFSPSVTPVPVELTAGGPPVTVRVSTRTEPGFQAPVTYQLDGLPPFVMDPGARTTAAPGYPVVSFPLSVTGAAAPGTYKARLVGRGGGATVTVSLSLVVSAGTFRAEVQPEPVELNAGGRATVTVRTGAERGFAAPIRYRFERLPGLSDDRGHPSHDGSGLRAGAVRLRGVPDGTGRELRRGVGRGGGRHADRARDPGIGDSERRHPRHGLAVADRSVRRRFAGAGHGLDPGRPGEQRGGLSVRGPPFLRRQRRHQDGERSVLSPAALLLPPARRRGRRHLQRVSGGAGRGSRNAPADHGRVASGGGIRPCRDAGPDRVDGRRRRRSSHGGPLRRSLVRGSRSGWLRGVADFRAHRWRTHRGAALLRAAGVPGFPRCGCRARDLHRPGTGRRGQPVRGGARVGDRPQLGEHTADRSNLASGGRRGRSWAAVAVRGERLRGRRTADQRQPGAAGGERAGALADLGVGVRVGPSRRGGAPSPAALDQSRRWHELRR